MSSFFALSLPAAASPTLCAAVGLMLLSQNAKRLMLGYLLGAYTTSIGLGLVIVLVYTPGGGHRFYEELGPATRNGTPDRAVVAAIFEKHDMSLLGPPLSAD